MRDRLRNALGTRDGVIAAYLFGSQATGETWAESDVDLGLLLDAEPEDPLQPAIIADELEREAGLESGVLDIQILNDAAPRFLFQVLKNGEVLYESDPSRRIDFETRSLSRYYDFLPFQRVQDEAQRERFRGRA